MIVANMATYPPRLSKMLCSVEELSPQVDKLNLVLNQYDTAPEEIQANPKVTAIIPEADTKDAGKFLPTVSPEDILFYVDDDFGYPEDYVQRTLSSLENINLKHVVASYHCTIYRRPPLELNAKALRLFLRYHLKPDTIAAFQEYIGAAGPIERSVYVDQIGTGLAVVRGYDAPPYDFMRSSRKFVDVRISRWCAENGIERVCLPRPEDWITYLESDETIEASFTHKHHRHVAEEIRSYAMKFPNRGRPVLG